MLLKRHDKSLRFELGLDHLYSGGSGGIHSTGGGKGAARRRGIKVRGMAGSSSTIIGVAWEGRCEEGKEEGREIVGEKGKKDRDSRVEVKTRRKEGRRQGENEEENEGGRRGRTEAEKEKVSEESRVEET
ncbi:hypothetical protein Pmani_029005 [Petrolisthes manimaculis]|uniref:Uncharacterized protein n=1 Tax=Petrolisthes manimaculis TaxID=1843537 RepID=A0AAE1TUW9_9EUCA|nr:hypothetical protein Pmani_029005 [Petrolisthes manimaculis]